MRQRPLAFAPIHPLEDRIVPAPLAPARAAALIAPPERAPTPVAPTPIATSASAARPADRSTALFEVRWMRGMIDHHGMAIAMSQQILKKTADPEIRALARGIIIAQAREIGQMTSWLRSGYGIRGVRPALDAEGRSMLRDLAAATGRDAEVMFLSQMIDHHGMAIREAADCLDNAGHALLRGLCGNIEQAQTAEIRQMQGILDRLGGHAM